jgi:hypothetical protein
MSEHLRQQWRTSSSGIQGFLRTVADMQRGVRESRNPDWKFQSVEELVLHYGREYEPAPLPEDITRGRMGDCYMNGMNLAMGRHDLTYVEGYADSGFFPTGHGWATADGRTAIDPTWEKAAGYFGVPFTHSFWSGWIARTGTWGVFFMEIPDDNLIGLLKNGLPPGAVA